MADDEMTAHERLRDRVDGQGRQLERLDERMSGKLGKDDATMLMDFATAGDTKLREDFLGRMSDLRSAVRDGFTHNEKETAAAIFKATTESEARSIKATNESEARLTLALNAINATLATMVSPASPGRAGVHWAVPAVGGGGAGMAVLYLVLAFLGMVPRPGG